MGLNEFKDTLFDVINETTDLPIRDVEVFDRKNQMKITLQDGSMFILTMELYGNRFLHKLS